MSTFKVVSLPKFCTYLSLSLSLFFIYTSKLRVCKIHLSDDYPKNTKKWEYKSQSSSLCNSLQWLFNSLSSKYFHYHFVYKCLSCMSLHEHCFIYLCTHKAMEKISITFSFSFFVRYENNS